MEPVTRGKVARRVVEVLSIISLLIMGKRFFGQVWWLRGKKRGDYGLIIRMHDIYMPLVYLDLHTI